MTLTITLFFRFVNIKIIAIINPENLNWRLSEFIFLFFLDKILKFIKFSETALKL